MIGLRAKDLKDILPMISLGFNYNASKAPPPFHGTGVRLGWAIRVLSLRTQLSR